MNNRIRVYRAKHNLTQEKMAHDLGVSRQTIIAAERGYYDPPLLLAFRIARYFSVSLGELFLFDEPGPGR